MAFGRSRLGKKGPFRGKITSKRAMKDGMVKIGIRRRKDGKIFYDRVSSKSQLLRFNKDYAGDVSFILNLEGEISSMGKMRPSVIKTLKEIGEY